MASKKPAKPKAPKLYKRYDPVSGVLAKVTKDDPRYEEWRTTKGTVASRKKSLLKKDPLEYAKTFGADEVGKRAVGAASRTGSVAAKSLSGKLASSAGALAPFVAPAVVAAATVAAAIAGWKLQQSNERIAAGERINTLSREFAATQNKLVSQYRVHTWLEVPADLRNKLLAGYKNSIAAISAQIYHAGSIRPSVTMPYGR